MPEEFDRQNSFGWMINVIANKATKDFDLELKKHGLSIALWPTLMCLWEEEGVTQRDIAAKSKVENSTTTRTLDKLEKLELVERRADPHSRRSFRIYLTEKGKALEEVLIPIPVKLNEELMASLDAKEQQQMIGLLKKMVAAV
ncbi:MarR family transcriptional regulator, transcriptional regulator for hemolysin [Vibrio crassostreae]|uniref:MarR family winged helix-turn-helix transcriptional regulator n=1 Tax=Vibrio crassostreae TaxID=246167 RepID=UPI00104AF635|nr:MarR family transcriptional regulator [Vibrio crassostreae]TCN86975.1 MarR family transcriptional regulator [Vibrio crassostreae]CAK2407946.1 MarR family transcriptional regulator, transcriptional regulator for hemolysin [Vibrio crassostreae]CAK2532064.1 MarR family transcriptional regulator, transcriptional regulator for hemolysin [Vibrio crassostreae]CAK3780286.1 MarR family transcriptional regulator, transcriptional regulator for hemolysin [Vibrio crassostreae]CAK3915573.1 MarR family tr